MSARHGKKTQRNKTHAKEQTNVKDKQTYKATRQNKVGRIKYYISSVPRQYLVLCPEAEIDRRVFPVDSRLRLRAQPRSYGSGRQRKMRRLLLSVARELKPVLCGCGAGLPPVKERRPLRSVLAVRARPPARPPARDVETCRECRR